MKVHQVAELCFSMGDGLDLVAEDINYKPFRTEKTIDTENYLFHIDTGSYQDLDFENMPNKDSYTNENGSYNVILKDGCYYWKLKKDGDERCYGMLLDLENKKAILDFEIRDEFAVRAADDFIRFAFIYTSAFHDTILLHASCIAYQGDGIAFTGHSGIGKSTHSSLWLKYVNGAELINDDQPAIRYINQKTYIFGTPWSGKTNCYKQMRAHLQAIICMKQAPENKLTALDTTSLFAKLLPACSLNKKDKATMPSIIRTLAKISENVRGAKLENRPEKEAVQLTYNFLRLN